MTKLTLVVPTYNLGHYVTEMLASLTKQTAEFELWLIDDHSTDGTAEKVAAFADTNPMFHVKQFETHQGVSVARNYGISHATGDAVAFADGDDVVHPDYVKTLIGGFQPGVKAVTVGYQWWHTPADQRSRYISLTQAEMFQQVSRRGTEVGGYVWNKAYDLNAIREIDLTFDESLPITEDYLFTATFVAQTPGEYVYNPVIQYTKVNRPNSTIHSRSAKDRVIEDRVFEEIYKMGDQL